MNAEQIEIHKHRAQEHYINGVSHDALHELAQATRIQVWLEMQKGIRPHMVECVKLHPKQQRVRTETPEGTEYAGVRRYYLETPPKRDPRITQAYEEIIAHKGHKAVPAKINW